MSDTISAAGTQLLMAAHAAQTDCLIKTNRVPTALLMNESTARALQKEARIVPGKDGQPITGCLVFGVPIKIASTFPDNRFGWEVR